MPLVGAVTKTPAKIGIEAKDFELAIDIGSRPAMHVDQFGGVRGAG
jgi:hypothetical protein